VESDLSSCVAWALSALLLGALHPGTASAQEAEYRDFQLSDGRRIVGLVLETGAEGMSVRVPQGIATVPYGLLSDIGVTDEAAVRDQPALVIAIAPIRADSLEARSMAARIDGWLSDLVELIPHTDALSAAAWQEGLGGSGFDLLGCAARVPCLAPLALKVSADRVLLPTLELKDGVGRLSLIAVVPSSSAEVAAGSAESGSTPDEHAAGILAAVFEALDIVPEIEVEAVAAQRFAPAPAEEPDPPVDSPEGSGDAPDEAVAAEPETPLPEGVDRPLPEGPDTELLRTIALGFAPVPGLNGAVNEDLPAFLTALLGGVGSTWAAVFAIGLKSRTPQEFAGPSLAAAYGLVVGWNQVSGLIGLAVRRRGGSAAKAGQGTTPVLLVAPAVSRDGAGGAVLLLHGRF
jgi:hypothetical protein